MSNIPKNLKKVLEDYTNAHKAIQKKLEPFILGPKYIQAFNKQLEPLVQSLNKIQQFGILLLEQTKNNFNDGLKSLVPPDQYVSNQHPISSGVQNMADSLAISLIDKDITNKPYSFLKERLEIGLSAHLEKNYHLSIYSVFSVIDGLLTWYYCEHNDCSHYPSFNQKYEYFIDNAYQFQNFVDVSTMRTKLNCFKQHRNEIMHGGKNAFFDQNLSSLSMLFLVLIYSSFEQLFTKS